MSDVSTEGLGLLTAVLNDPRCTEDHLESLENNSELKKLGLQIFAVRNFAMALAQGDLRYACQEQGVTLGALKTLASNLRHVTWKMHGLLKGDYSRSDPYMGELSVMLNVLCDELHHKTQELDERLKKYMDLSYLDMLTGLLNRRGFLKASQREMRSVLRGDSHTCLILVDIDHFKEVNDTYGHKVGDLVLKNFADRLQNKLRPRDMCCRYGGEEFAVLLPGVDLATAMEIAERQRVACATPPFYLDKMEISITGSFGVTEVLIEDSGITAPETLLERALLKADQALYAAKHQGRNRVCCTPLAPDMEQA